MDEGKQETGKEYYKGIPDRLPHVRQMIQYHEYQLRRLKEEQNDLESKRMGVKTV